MAGGGFLAVGTLAGNDSKDKPYKKEERKTRAKATNPFNNKGIPAETAVADKMLDGINTLDFDAEYFARTLVTGTLAQQERILDIFEHWMDIWADAYDEEGMIDPVANARLFNLAAKCKRIAEVIESYS